MTMPMWEENLRAEASYRMEVVRRSAEPRGPRRHWTEWFPAEWFRRTSTAGVSMTAVPTVASPVTMAGAVGGAVTGAVAGVVSGVVTATDIVTDAVADVTDAVTVLVTDAVSDVTDVVSGAMSSAMSSATGSAMGSDSMLAQPAEQPVTSG